MKYFKPVVFVVLVFLSLISSYANIIRLNLPYNDQGRYFDEERSIVYHEQSIFSFGFFTIVLLLLTLLIGILILRSLKVKADIQDFKMNYKISPLNIFAGIVLVVMIYSLIFPDPKFGTLVIVYLIPVIIVCLVLDYILQKLIKKYLITCIVEFVIVVLFVLLNSPVLN